MFFCQPLDQFDIFLINLNLIFNYDIISINNCNCILQLYNMLFLSNLFIYLFIISLIIIIITGNAILFRFKLIYDSVWQYILEKFVYLFPLNVLVSQAGKRSESFFIYIGSLFFFILLANFIGLIPNSFTITSHIILTFLLGSITVIGLTIIGFIKQKLHFFQLFVPKGVPNVLLPMLIGIEVVSYIARGFSLSIRLFANLMSGHSLIHILIFFIVKILKYNYIIGIIGLFLIIIIFLLEFGISFLQAYVFIVLVSIYLKDSYDVGH